jgi:2-amino-4-hydroxy-6-hydroxymethyldihydropteridine diphosphokinase
MTKNSKHLYLIALGSNQRHHLFGSPAKILAAAFEALEMSDISVFATSQTISSKPIGPSQREYANAAALVVSLLDPLTMLERLKSLESHFGRRALGQKWRSRILDLDIILWSGGSWMSASGLLQIPHREMQHRRFVLQPANEIAANWRDPISGLQIKQLFHRIKRANRLDQQRAAN